MTAAGQSYSLRAQNHQWRIEIPEYNYRESSLKSHYFQFGYYIPSERRWQTYQRHCFLPPCTLRDAIDIQRENDYISLKHNQDTCRSQVPSVKWNSHKCISQEPCVVHHFARCYSPSRVYPCGYFEALDSFIVVSVDHRIPTAATQALLSVMEYCPNHK
ncbi:hypothetical protein EmuJ_001055500 [Echinococcus multilocularis]|uniref:Uncharacterized protein n=1 Tax=Echinococcus multilocularis TaxID=6211 RepID=A0A068YL09_ECHMU|nr:hypothetical protein EmuJ_001055500 [Echinococcus multilocularis]